MMKQTHIYLTALLWCLFLGYSVPTNAQTHEMGVSLGAMNYQGDMSSFINITNPGIGGGFFYRINPRPAFSFKLNGNYGYIQHADRLNKDAVSAARGFEFQTNILELGFQVEYNFFDLGRDKRDEYRWTPYLFAGVAGFFFDPVKNTRPTYGKFSMAIPFGLGIKYALSPTLNLGMSFEARRTFTDNLDDLNVDGNAGLAAPRDPKLFTGNPNDKDYYFFTVLSLSYVFPQDPCPVKIPRSKVNRARIR
ncbi:DUF6089 family protein [Eisenibacter elegans]|jgi:hypothetical protein|uniref:type IX secretion system protein PorG n=1 Tax=Eisenibacter elegans TaxID=997 RepID=UPI000410BE03|nr:DUF6089 family protein [Eisenibacter elegans]